MSFFEKLSKIEALIQNTSSEGERLAAQLAKERILSKISVDRSDDQPIEYTVSLGSSWEKRLFVALCKKYGFQTYRYQRQKHTTARLKISKKMMKNVLWPDYLRYSEMLGGLIEDIMKELINKIYKVEEEEILMSGELEFKQM